MTHLHAFLKPVPLALMVLFSITACQKDELKKDAPLETHHEIPLTHLEVNQVNIGTIPEVNSYLNQLLLPSGKKNNATQTPQQVQHSTQAGIIPLANATSLKDSLGIVNYTLPIHTQQHYTNRFYNLIVKQEPTHIEAYVLEYHMDATFAASYFAGETTMASFYITVKSTMSTAFLANFNQQIA